MELLKLPAGRLATVFYKDEPQQHTRKTVTDSPTPPDMEKGSLDPALHPVLSGRSRRSGRSLQNQLDSKSQAFAWKDISLDIKTNEGTKRLLDSMDGEYAIRRVRSTTDVHNRLGHAGSADGFNGCIWSWQGNSIRIMQLAKLSISDHTSKHFGWTLDRRHNDR